MSLICTHNTDIDVLEKERRAGVLGECTILCF